MTEINLKDIIDLEYIFTEIDSMTWVTEGQLFDIVNASMKKSSCIEQIGQKLIEQEGLRVYKLTDETGHYRNVYSFRELTLSESK